MLLLDPKTIFRFQPDPTDDALIFYLRIPTVIDRSRYRHAVRSAGGKQWTQWQMLDGIVNGLKAILCEPEDQEERDKHIGEVAAYRERMQAFVNDVRSGALRAADDPETFRQRAVDDMSPPQVLQDMERVVVDSYPPYAAMVADREVYYEIAGMVAARMFLRGWEGIDAPFKCIRGEVPDVVLGNLTTLQLAQIGMQIERMLEPNQDRLKNSPSPSGTEPDPTVSSGTATPQGNGHSSTISGAASSSALMN